MLTPVIAARVGESIRRKNRVYRKSFSIKNRKSLLRFFSPFSRRIDPLFFSRARVIIGISKRSARMGARFKSAIKFVRNNKLRNLLR